MKNEIRIPQEKVKESNLTINDLELVGRACAELGINIHRDSDTKELIFTESEEYDDSDGWTPEEWLDDNAEDNFSFYLSKAAQSDKISKYGGEPQ